MLTALRYLLIVIPALGTAVLLPLDQMNVFTFHLLLFLVYAGFRRDRLAPALQQLLTAVEIVWVGWLSHRYPGLLFACHYSTMTTYLLQRQAGTRWLFLPIQAVLMNAALSSAGLELRFTSNLLLASGALLLYRLGEAGSRQAELETVYDELRSKAYELEQTRRRLVDYAGKVEELAQAEERSRIAHDIHDDLGHKLIRLKLMLEAVVRIAPASPDKGLELTRQVLDQLGEGMETLRHTVRRMKPDKSQVRGYSLDRLIEELSAGSGLEVNYRVHGLARPLYPSLEIVLFRNSQEAVTNAIRHGEATEVTIDLYYEAEHVRLAVSNNGRLPESSQLSKGLGLVGMEERARLVGGEVRTVIDSRFTVETLVPMSA
ncbi:MULTISPECIES: sensor histidine kinase [Paenibacillus]|uniref:sensor histidine kinase n=1 Tax=Paenibacillus TaxID=44249 RepID=UPI0022B86814|nr:sensor histidine kinase [Paenibacillus caseinilyticus]MCZ8520272.1 sensor histidine kinase [Paenibacillus caseinilyticus]